MTEQRDMTAEGNTYIVGQGPAVPARAARSRSSSRGCRTSRCGRGIMALALAVVILAAGAWARLAAGAGGRRTTAR